MSHSPVSHDTQGFHSVRLWKHHSSKWEVFACRFFPSGFMHTPPATPVPAWEDVGPTLWLLVCSGTKVWMGPCIFTVTGVAPFRVPPWLTAATLWGRDWKCPRDFSMVLSLPEPKECIWTPRLPEGCRKLGAERPSPPLVSSSEVKKGRSY